MIRSFPGGPENKRIVGARTYVPPPPIFALVALLALGWGFNWPVMKVVMAEMPPLHFRVLCLVAGAAGLFAIARANRLPIRVPPGAWPRLIAITLFNVAAWNVLAVYGLTFMESGRAAILAYTFPVWGVLLGVWVLREPVTGSRLTGVVLGVLGMLVLLGARLQRARQLDLLQLGVDQDRDPRPDQRFLALHVDDPDRGRVQRHAAVGRTSAVERSGRARLGRRCPGGRAPAAAPGIARLVQPASPSRMLRRLGILSVRQFASAQFQISAILPAASSAGGSCPRKRKACQSRDGACVTVKGAARVCLLSFSPAWLTATGRCMYRGVG